MEAAKASTKDDVTLVVEKSSSTRLSDTDRNKQFLIDFAPSMTNFVFGGMYATSCQPIPSLSAFLLTHGVLSLLKASYSFYYRLPTESKCDKEDDSTERVIAQKVDAYLVPMCIWGSIIIYPKTNTKSI